MDAPTDTTNRVIEEAIKASGFPEQSIVDLPLESFLYQLFQQSGWAAQAAASARTKAGLHPGSWGEFTSVQVKVAAPLLREFIAKQK